MTKRPGSALQLEEQRAEAYFHCTRPSTSSAHLQPSKRPAGIGIVLLFPGYSHCLVVRCPLYARSDADGIANCALSLLDRYGLDRLMVNSSVDVLSRVEAVDLNPVLINARTDFERLGDEIGRRVELAPRFSRKTLSKRDTRLVARATKAAREACVEAASLHARDPDSSNSLGGINRILDWHEEDIELSKLDV